MSKAQLARKILSSFSSHPGICAHHSSIQRHSNISAQENSDYAFEFICSTVRFGSGVTAEIGHDLRSLAAKNTMILTDAGVSETAALSAVVESLDRSAQKYQLFEDVRVEPSDKSMLNALEIARNGQFDSFVAVGGGSVIDTAKIAALYSSHPDADFFDFVTEPFGLGLVPSKPMLPLIAVPTTAGTGSETTGVAIFDFAEKQCKTGIRHRCLKPLLALIDPLNIISMPRHVAIYSGFDILCHALESYTAKPFYSRSPRPKTPSDRPLYQGSNPISDIWAQEALQIVSKYFRRSVFDPDDLEAKTQMLMASSFAGMGFGNAGVHLCHGLSYPISSQVLTFKSPDYPTDHALIPHGLSVVSTACADFKFSVYANPQRHSEAAQFLGVSDTINASPECIGAKIAESIQSFMRDFRVPNGLNCLGFDRRSIDQLTNAAMNSSSALRLSPREHTRDIIADIYEQSMHIY